ncbi:MAG: glycosyltransferase [Neisseria sp.]|nr:glycosyltransferase [Neisseria sp.]
MNIAIIAPFCSLPDEAYFNRFLYLAQLLSEKHRVTLYTSHFRHHDKTFRRCIEPCASGECRLQIRLLEETGYQRNISFKRIRSHQHFVQNLQREIITWQPKQFDVVYSAYPLITSNILLADYKKRLGFKLIVDVQDVWPESFSAVLPLVQKLPTQLLPYSRKADLAYRGADALIAVSQSYLARATRATPLPAERTLVAYIGADAEQIERVQPSRPEWTADGIKRLFYLGTLSHSYDVYTVAQAVKQLAEQGEAIELHVFGGGKDETRLQALNHDSLILHGFLPYAEMLGLAKSCDIAVNAIHRHAPQSITNKLSDYLLLSKPILNSQSNAEARDLIAQLPHQHYQSGNVASCIKAIKLLLKQTDKNSENTLNPNIREQFDRRISYPKIVDLIERVVQQ